MPHVVCEPCINCKHTNCVSVCPVNCFHQGPNFLAIDPEKCIDCALCVYECPVKAILEEEDVPEHWVEYIGLNANLSKVWPVITQQKPPLATAEEFRDVEIKRHLLDTETRD